MAGGRGSHLMNLTRNCVKPAVAFGGKFRIIDFALSNCINSGARRIGVLTQYSSHQLIIHMQKGWGFLPRELDEFVVVLPAIISINMDYGRMLTYHSRTGAKLTVSSLQVPLSDTRECGYNPGR